MQGDWEYHPGDWRNDATKDAPWEDPKIWRRKIGTPDELAAVADAIVRGIDINETCPHDPPGSEPRSIVGKVGDPKYPGIQSHGLSEHVIVEDLKALIEAVQAHPKVKLAKVEAEEDDDGFLRVMRCWMENARGDVMLGVPKPSELRLWHSIIERTAPKGEGYGELDIGVTLRLAARFDGKADFGSARFAGEAVFGSVHFAGWADFESARFAGGADFGSARFAEWAGFRSARFAGVADFRSARFAGGAGFGSARFVGVAIFGSARFDGGAGFRSARFAGVAGFGSARFAGGALFWSARFDGEAGFRSARFDGWALFWSARFVDDANFRLVRVRRAARLEFIGTRFARSVRFDGDPKNKRPLIRGTIFFTDATLDERLTFHKTRFGKHARLGFNRFLARGGATVELTGEQLRLGNPVPKEARTPFKRLGAALYGWLWFFNRTNLRMEGADSTDPDPKARAEAIQRAADDYELLAVNYTRQPARDPEEDGCRWMAHELARKAEWIRSWEDVRKKRKQAASTGQTPIQRVRSAMGWLAALILWVLENIIGRWLVQRTMVGFLLEWWRPVASGAVLILVYAALYWFVRTPTTYLKDGSGSVWDSLYFSIVTFTSLGYGDIQPKGWFKGVAASEALAGLTLMALFTVSWARKMVR